MIYVQVNANLALLGRDTVDAPPTTPTFNALAPQNLVITKTPLIRAGAGPEWAATPCNHGW